jgi:Mn-containing catalase
MDIGTEELSHLEIIGTLSRFLRTEPESALVTRLSPRSNGYWLEYTYEHDQDRAFRCRS